MLSLLFRSPAFLVGSRCFFLLYLMLVACSSVASIVGHVRLLFVFGGGYVVVVFRCW